MLWSSWFSSLVLNGDPMVHKVGFCLYDSKRFKKCNNNMHEMIKYLMAI